VTMLRPRGSIGGDRLASRGQVFFAERRLVGSGMALGKAFGDLLTLNKKKGNCLMTEFLGFLDAGHKSPFGEVAGHNPVLRLSTRIDHIGDPSRNGLLCTFRCKAGVSVVDFTERYDYTVFLASSNWIDLFEGCRFFIEHGASPDIHG
jgi:hypothetical protein